MKRSKKRPKASFARLPSPVWVSLLVGALGCGNAETSLAAVGTVRDSSGVRVVEYSGPLVGKPVAAQLEWEYGFQVDEYPFQSVFMGALRPNGGAVLVDGGNREVVEIDSLGVSYSLLAESGQGPAEVRSPRVILVRGDTTWVEDPGNTKLMRFEGSELVSTTNTGVNETLARSMMPLALTEDGRLLMVTSSYRSRFEQEWLDGHVTRLDWTTLTLDTVAAYPMASRRPETGINPFGQFGFVAGYFDGYIQGRTDRPEILWRDADGAVRQIVRWTPDLAYPTPELWSQFEQGLRAELRRVNPQMSPERVQEFLDERVAAYSVDEDESLPLFGRLLASDEGSVWLPPYSTLRQRPTHYTMLAREGEEISNVVFPRPVSILDVRGSLALGVVEDSLGVQAVAVYRIGS